MHTVFALLLAPEVGALIRVPADELAAERLGRPKRKGGDDVSGVGGLDELAGGVGLDEALGVGGKHAVCVLSQCSLHLHKELLDWSHERRVWAHPPTYRPCPGGARQT
jgi:hypothetical protein